MNRKYYSNLFNLKGLGQFKTNPVLFGSMSNNVGDNLNQ